MHPFLVLDENALRDACEVKKAAEYCRQFGLGILIPDGAFFEFCKVSQPAETWRRVLTEVAAYPEVVFISRKITEIISEERKTKDACPNLVSDQATQFTRNMLHELQTGRATALENFVNHRMCPVASDSLRLWNEHGAFKADLQDLQRIFKEMPDGMPLTELRRSPGEKLPAWVSSLPVTRHLFESMRRKTDDLTAVRLMIQASMSAAFPSALFALAGYWLAFGGLESAPPKKITNDFHDIEYVVFGALTGGLVTNDKRMQTIYVAVRESSAARAELIRSWLSI